VLAAKKSAALGITYSAGWGSNTNGRTSGLFFLVPPAGFPPPFPILILAQAHPIAPQHFPRLAPLGAINLGRQIFRVERLSTFRAYIAGPGYAQRIAPGCIALAILERPLARPTAKPLVISLLFVRLAAVFTGAVLKLV
jgi:hypothetical protein